MKSIAILSLLMRPGTLPSDHALLASSIEGSLEDEFAEMPILEHYRLSGIISLGHLTKSLRTPANGK